jgi:hypothetical protein
MQLRTTDDVHEWAEALAVRAKGPPDGDRTREHVVRAEAAALLRQHAQDDEGRKAVLYLLGTDLSMQARRAANRRDWACMPNTAYAKRRAGEPGYTPLGWRVRALLNEARGA